MNHGDTEAQRNRLNELSGTIIRLCIEIHRELGPGLLESTYEECLAYELSKAGVHFERQRALPVRYKEVQLDCGYRLDFVVEVDQKSLGLLINFNVPALKQGMRRVVCGDLFEDKTGVRGFVI
jgi:hypothetical protein